MVCAPIIVSHHILLSDTESEENTYWCTCRYNNNNNNNDMIGRPLPDPPPPPRYIGISPLTPHAPATTMSTDGAAASPTNGRLTPSMNNYIMDSRLEKASPRSLSFTRTRSGFDTAGPSSRVQSPAPTGALLSPSSANGGALGSGAPSPVPTSPGQEGKGRSMRRAHMSSASHSNTGGGPNSNNGMGGGGSASGSAPHSPLHPSGLRMSSGPLPGGIVLGTPTTTAGASSTILGTPSSNMPSPPLPPHSLHLHANSGNGSNGPVGAISPHGSSSALLGPNGVPSNGIGGMRSPSLSLSPRARMKTSSQLPPSISNAHLPLPAPSSANSSSSVAGASSAQASSPPTSTRNSSRPQLLIGIAADATSPPEHMRHLQAHQHNPNGNNNGNNNIGINNITSNTNNNNTVSATNTMVSEPHPFGTPDDIPSPSLGSSTLAAGVAVPDMTPSLGPALATAEPPDLNSKPLPSTNVIGLPAYSESPLSLPIAPSSSGIILPMWSISTVPVPLTCMSVRNF
jgi:hypothetical protein